MFQRKLAPRPDTLSRWVRTFWKIHVVKNLQWSPNCESYLEHCMYWYTVMCHGLDCLWWFDPLHTGYYDKLACFELDFSWGDTKTKVWTGLKLSTNPKHINLNLPCIHLTAYTTFFIMGLLMSMQVPFVGFQPIRTSEHMAAAGRLKIVRRGEGLNLKIPFG